MPRLNQRRRTTTTCTTFTTPITSTVLMPVPEAEAEAHANQQQVHRISPSSSIGSDMNHYQQEQDAAFTFPDVTKKLFVDHGFFDENNNAAETTTAMVSLSDGLSDLSSSPSSNNTTPMLSSRSQKSGGLTRSKSMKHGLSDLASICSSSSSSSETTTTSAITRRRLNSMYLKESDKLTALEGEEQAEEEDEEVDATWGHFVEHNNISRAAAAFQTKCSSSSFNRAPYSISKATGGARRCFLDNYKRSKFLNPQHHAKQKQHYQASTAVDEYFHALSL
eukprot:CAMPEP_0196806128 /NCGR_PEP_ID=MMETSP1362-20130617/5992_1 /TAXON_ID=163516 /ORGANISM="Leptocylindrus danicus, Strain CCMP1856" /LENGTH=277 /DNA_ID=CAMNT_0042179447 /DNA_START=124 /DNA_END=957 /DNA_ORIENTATION=+